jgi:hypothetical protein
MHDYKSSSASITTPTDVMDRKEKLGTKDKNDHFPGNNLNKKNFKIIIIVI